MTKELTNTNILILSITDLNNRLRQSGFMTARVKPMSDLTTDERTKCDLIAVMEKGTKDFCQDILSKVLKKTVVKCVYYKDDCVKVETVKDDRPDEDDV